MKFEQKKMRLNDFGEECMVIPNSEYYYYITKNGDPYRYSIWGHMVKLHAYDRGTSHAITICPPRARRHQQKIDTILAETWGIKYALKYLEKHNLKKNHLYVSEIRDIKKKYSDGATTRTIAQKYNVTQQAIVKIIKKNIDN